MKKNINLNFTYDKETDAAYIYFENILNGGVASTDTCDSDENKSVIMLDFDNQKRMIGIEVLEASKKLPNYLLKLLQNEE